MHALFHLAEFDGIDAPLLCLDRRLFRRDPVVCCCKHIGAQFRSLGHGNSASLVLRWPSDLTCAALLPPKIVFIVAGEDLDLTTAYFEDSRGEFVDEIAIVRDENDRSCEFL